MVILLNQSNQYLPEQFGQLGTVGRVFNDTKFDVLSEVVPEHDVLRLVLVLGVRFSVLRLTGSVSRSVSSEVGAAEGPVEPLDSSAHLLSLIHI